MRLNLMQIVKTLATVVGASLVAYWVFHARTATDQPFAPEDNPLNTDFDYFITAMKRTNFSADGAVLNQLQAARVQHYPEDDRAELELPRFHWFNSPTLSWQLEATTGQLLTQQIPGIDILKLEDQVQLSRPLPDGEILTITTSQLEADMTTKTFQTAQPVSLSSATMHMTSIGMKGQLDGKKLELLQEVKARYE